MNLETFINTYRSQAEAIDFQKENALAYGVFQKRKQFLENAEFENEKQEGLLLVQKAMTDLKDRLLLTIRNESYLNCKNVKHTAFIVALRAYLEYRELYFKYHNSYPEPIDVNQNKTKKIITELFDNIDNQGWKYAFKNDNDYNLFMDLLTDFFELKTYTLPKATISLKRTCKTKVAKVLGEIHSELGDGKLIDAKEYFTLIKVLNHFENEKEGDLYKSLTR